MAHSAQAVFEALEFAISTAPEAKRNALAQAVEDYAKAYPRTWGGLTSHRQAPFMLKLIETIIEASDARVQS